METRKIYFRPSARAVLESSPEGVANLLANYLNLVEGFARTQEVRSSRTEVAGHQSRGETRQQLTIVHTVALNEGDMVSYRRHLGTEIEKWIRGLSPEEVNLVGEWLILEVKADPEGLAG